MRSSSARAASGGAVLVLVAALAATATDPPAKNALDRPPPPVASRSHDGNDPDKRATSSVQYKSSEGHEARVVLIHPQTKASANYIPGLRFHRPLLALAERVTPLDGFPPIVDDVHREPDGTTYVRFRVVVSSADLRKQARNAVLDQERALVAQEKLTPDDVQIEPWPLKHMVATLRHSFTGEVLAVAQTGTLTGIRDEFTLDVALAPADLTRFRELVASNKLSIVYTYSYTGMTSYHGTVDLKAVTPYRAEISATVYITAPLGGSSLPTQARRIRFGS